MAKSGSKLKEHRAVIRTAVLTQFAALLVGIVVLYSCARASPGSATPFQEAVYLGVVGPPGMTVILFPFNLLLLGLLGVLFFLGRRKARLLWHVGILLWGAWWVFMTYIICAMADD